MLLRHGTDYRRTVPLNIAQLHVMWVCCRLNVAKTNLRLIQKDGEARDVWTINILPHIREPSDGIRCRGAHLASSLLDALRRGTVWGVEIRYSSPNAGLLEVGYRYRTPGQGGNNRVG